mmetsp:Transcript_38750/g.107658  ORF Transcript_38750/g.107658 Transcript_38750/m.107658 type:complete len:204 (-) Transcript_38750:301-912(-)
MSKSDEDTGDRPASPFERTSSKVEEAEDDAAKDFRSKFSGLTVVTSVTPSFEGREFRAGIMIVGRRIRGILKRKGTSGFRMYKDKYFMLHNGKMMMFDSEKHYMSGSIPTPDQITYVNLYDLDEQGEDTKFGFRLVPKSVSEHTKHTLHFRALDAEAKEIWLDNLRRVPDLVVMDPKSEAARPKGDADEGGSDEGGSDPGTES